MLIINVVLLGLALMAKFIGFALLANGGYYALSRLAGMLSICIAFAALAVAVVWVNLPMTLVSLTVLGLTAGVYTLEKRYTFRPKYMDQM